MFGAIFFKYRYRAYASPLPNGRMIDRNAFASAVRV
jgi:hypothetical protein